MSHHVVARSAGRVESGAGCYQRHDPKQTLLYQIIEQHYPAFAAHLVAKARNSRVTSNGNSRIT